MRILYILAFQGLSRPLSGGQNRFRNIVHQIAVNGHSLVVIEPEQVYDPQDCTLSNIRRYDDLKVFGKTLSVMRDMNPGFARVAFGVIRNLDPDIVQVSHPSGVLMVNLISRLRRRKEHKRFIVLDMQNVESSYVSETFARDERYNRLQRLIITQYVGVIEKIACRHLCDAIITVSESDRTQLMRKHNLIPEKLHVVPSGCRIEQLPTKDERLAARRSYGIPEGTIVLAFHGSFHHLPNKEALDLIEDIIAPRFQTSRNVMFLVGGSESPKFQRNNIKSVGPIDNLRTYLCIPDIAIVPIRHGGGTKLKVLDYMSFGIPMVTTEKGIEGLKVQHNEEAMVTRDVDEQFLANLEHLINNEPERVRLGKNARTLAEREYDWTGIGVNLNSIYKTLSSRNARS